MRKWEPWYVRSSSLALLLVSEVAARAGLTPLGRVVVTARAELVFLLHAAQQAFQLLVAGFLGCRHCLSLLV